MKLVIKWTGMTIQMGYPVKRKLLSYQPFADQESCLVPEPNRQNPLPTPKLLEH